MNRQYDLAGEWKVRLGKKEEDGESCSIMLPGTLDEAGKQIPNMKKNPEREEMHLTPEYHYEGSALYEREIELTFDERDTLILSMERTRATRVWVNGQYAGSDSSLICLQEYDITKLVHQGSNTVAVEVSNDFVHLPRQAILDSHMASAHTQTNWNGIVGEIKINVYPAVCVRKIRASLVKDRMLLIKVNIEQNYEILCSASLELYLDQERVLSESRVLAPGHSCLEFYHELEEDFAMWDEFIPALHELRAVLYTDSEIYEKSSLFGLRKFEVSADKRHFVINGRTTFIRSETNCAVFPQTGYAPMTENEWERLFQTYLSYGVNYVRFHSWCPPEAAFRAADRLGIYMQPELSEWTFEAFDSDEAYAYYTKEAVQIERCYGAHPSYIMLTWGNELRSHKRERLGELCRYMKQLAPDKLYAEGSNVWYGEEGTHPDSGFVLAQGNGRRRWRGAYAGNTGVINDCAPNTVFDYDEVLKGIEKPVISFEAGQFQVYPDYQELNKYTGNLKPRNLEAFKHQLKGNGLEGMDAGFQTATGMLSELCYREEIEAALRSERLAGISLLGLQDFPGQGAALIGMLDAFGNSKKFSDPRRFKRFFNSVVPLLKLKKRIFTVGENISAELWIANYGKGALKNEIRLSVKDESEEVFRDTVPACEIGQGCVKAVKTLNFVYRRQSEKSQKLHVEISILGTEYQNDYDIWVFPKVEDGRIRSSKIVYELNEEARVRLQNGERLLFLPKSSQEQIPMSVRSSFISDFWCWVMFKKWDQQGTMGMLIDNVHEIFKNMPADEYTNFQWWHMLKGSRSMIIDHTGISPIIRMVDNINRNHSMSLLHEVGCENGSLLVCSLNIAGTLERPETRWFVNCMLKYLESENGGRREKCSFEELLLSFPRHREISLVGAIPFVSINEQDAYEPLQKTDRYWDTAGSAEEDEKYFGLRFAREQTIDMIQIKLLIDDVYDGKAGHDLPESIQVEYLRNGVWKPANIIYESFLTSGSENRVYFQPISTRAVKINFIKEKKDLIYISAMNEYVNQPYGVLEIKLLGKSDENEESKKYPLVSV